MLTISQRQHVQCFPSLALFSNKPGGGVGANEHGEELLASPELQGLDNGRLRQIHSIKAVAHVADEEAHLCTRVEAVLARQQE